MQNDDLTRKKNDQAAAVLDSLVADIRRVFLEDRTILSFKEYFNLVIDSPERHLRCSAQYLVDMLHHFGYDDLDLPYGKVKRFRLFDAPFGDTDRKVAGQEAVQEPLYRALANFAREGRVNKLILMHGPNGSAKSSICRALMSGMENYAHLAEGAVYTYNWIFPSERLQSQGHIGFGATDARKDVGETFAFIPPEHVDARVPCEMHDHPLFLLPQQSRLGLLRQLLPEPNANTPADPDAKPHTAISDYLRHGDLCYKCRRIYDALLANYDGDVQKVLSHVQVERLYLSRRYRRGIATIEPQLSVDARIQQVTADRSLASLPKSLQHISLYEPAGPLVDANRGLLEYSDLLKRPVESFKYLLSTVETAQVSMESFVLHLDMVYMASTNETYLDAFKEHPDFSSFKGRIELIKVPYLLHYGSEKEIYTPHVTKRVVGRHVAPHAIDVAAMWAVLTRMRRNDASLYPKEITEVIAALSPLEKLCLYDTGEVPEYLTTSEAKELRHLIPELYQETLGYPNYEGRFGASAREIRTALLNAAHHGGYKCLHPVAVFDELKAILASNNVYDFLSQEVVGKYHDHKVFLETTEQMYVGWIDDEVRDAMGLASEDSYQEQFNRYVSHVSHWVKNEKMRDVATGKLRDPDESLMGNVERVLISEGERKEDFRRAVIGTIGARSLDNPQGGMPDYAAIFKPYIHRLREDFFSSRHRVLSKLVQNFLRYTAGEGSGLDPKEAEAAASMLRVLEEKYLYCGACAHDTVAYLAKKRYAE